MIDLTWKDLACLLEEHDGAIFIAHINRFRENVHALKAAFKKHYPHLGIGYSYKTNHLPKLCTVAHEEGLYAEVVSGTELDIAQTIGVPGNRVIFNGPTKSTDELKSAFTKGALVNIDSLSEAHQIANIASKHSGTIRLGLRCNLDLKWKDHQSRFGLSEKSGELDKAWCLLSAHKNVRIEGLHCHTSFDRSAESYSRRIIRLIEIADRLFGTDGPQFLDIGGGLTGPMSDDLRKQFTALPATFDEYAAAICHPLLQRYGRNGPELILEPGVGLVGNVFDYAFRVEHLKQVDTKWFAMTSGAAHHLKIVPNNFNIPLRLLQHPALATSERQGDSIDIAGFTCLEHDLIYRNYENPLLTGDILIAENVGAYSMVSSPDFIRTNPPVYERTDAGWVSLRLKKSLVSYLKEFNW